MKLVLSGVSRAPSSRNATCTEHCTLACSAMCRANGCLIRVAGRHLAGGHCVRCPTLEMSTKWKNASRVSGMAGLFLFVCLFFTEGVLTKAESENKALRHNAASHV